MIQKDTQTETNDSKRHPNWCTFSDCIGTPVVIRVTAQQGSIYIWEEDHNVSVHCECSGKKLPLWFVVMPYTLTDACIMYHLTGPLGVTISDKQYFSATWTKLRGNESYFSYLIVFKQILH